MSNHSPVGGSAAARFIACPGSVGLIEDAKDIEIEEDETYSLPGTVAHSVAEQCVGNDKEPWQFIRKEIQGVTVDKEIADAITEYTEYINKQTSPLDVAYIEHRFHCPELHEMYVGTADYVIVRENEIHVIDYKHGAGIKVPAKENPQLMYYAAGVLESMNLWGKDMNIVLHIVQPRTRGPAGNKWVTNTEALDAWLWDILIPAMEQAFTDSAPVNPGEHCRFCKVRGLKCPGIMKVIEEVEKLMSKGIDELSNEEVGRLLDLDKVFAIAKTAALKTATARLQLGQTVPGWKLVKARALRAWKEGSEDVIKERFGGRAYAPAKLKSPAQIEKLSGGKEIVKDWSVKPDKGMTLAQAKDDRESPKNATLKGVFKNQSKGK